MNNRSLRLDRFIAEFQFCGEWEVSYTDGTHLPQLEYVKLGDITIDTSEKIGRRYPILPFTFRPVDDQEIQTRFSEIIKCHFQNLIKEKKLDAKEQADRAEKLIREQLAESLVRTGLLRPKFCLMEGQTTETDFHKVMRKLSRYGYLVVVADTSALRRAAISILHKTLTNVLIWTVVPVFVMNEVQRQVRELSVIWEGAARGTQPHPGKCDILKKRPLVSCISQELTHIRRWRPLEMLTTLPEHLGQSNGQSRIDRLIIESVKNLKRDRWLHQGVYLLSGDKDMVSLATLENQGSLHIDVPSQPPNFDISSVRFDPHNRKLVLTPVHCLLWDLALVFGKIRLKNKEDFRTYELDYYSPVRGGFFARDVMGIREP